MNWDFETGLGDWVAGADATIEIINTDQHTGTQCMKVTSVGSTGDHSATLQFTGLTKGMYKLSVWGKGTMGIGIRILPELWGFWGAGWDEPFDDWNEKSIVFYVHDPDAYSILVLPPGGNRSVLIDDLTLEPTTGPLLVDFDTDKYLIGQVRVNLWDPSTDFAHSGTRSVKTALNRYQIFPADLYPEITPGYDYTYSCWAYVPTGSAPVTMGTEYGIGTDLLVTSTLYDTWEKLELTITHDYNISLGGGVYPIVRCNSAAPVYVDDWEISWTGSYSNQTLRNSFEDYDLGTGNVESGCGFFYWGTSVPPMGEIVDTKAKDGTKSLFLQLPDSEGLTGADIPAWAFSANSYYTQFDPICFSAWVYVPAGNPAVSLVTYGLNYVIQHECVSTKYDEWELLSISTKYDEIVNVNYNEMVFRTADGTAGEFYVDLLEMNQFTVMSATVDLSAVGQALELTGVFPYLNPLNAYCSTSMSVNYRGPIALPPIPEAASQTNPAQATGLVVRPMMGLLVDPNHNPVISGGKPT